MPSPRPLADLLLTTPVLIQHSSAPDAALAAVGPGALSILQRIASAASSSGAPSDILSLAAQADDLLHLARCKLHAYPYREVPLAWRRLWTDASILKAVLQIRLALGERARETGVEVDWEAEVVKTLDMALIMAGAPGEKRRETIDELLEAVHEEFPKAASGLGGKEAIGTERVSRSPKRVRLDVADFAKDIATSPPDSIRTTRPIPLLASPPSIPEFQHHLSNLNTPVLIRGLTSHWPALTTHPWSSSTYLLSRTNSGKRLVPVELGRSYTDTGWGQRILPFRDFLSTHVLAPSSTTGYLAQHDLFAQIPALRADIAVPDYCYATSPPPSPPNVKTVPQLDEPMLNAWFGPRGTISPLHTDPYANLLVQAVGTKYVRLYAPEDTSRVYPRGVEDGGVDMSNTSEVDVENPDLERYPEFKEAKYWECVLGEGEALFIPTGWWHYVRSLSVSFSVSFWWN